LLHNQKTMDKINSANRCVYTSPFGLCHGTSPLHPKEHYLPAGLGNFKGDIRLKNYICYDCQKRFSQFEEVFLRNGTEAFFRSILGFRGRKGHDGKNIFIEPTLGLPPLTVKGVWPALQHELLWQVTTQDQAHLLKQLVFRKSDGSLTHVAIRDGYVARDLARLGESWKDWQLIVCIAGDAEEAELQSVLGPALATMKDASMDAPLCGEVEAKMNAQITLPYVRAIAKIGFHFILAHFHFSGLESEFDDLKRFIYLGAGKPRARIVDDILLPELIPEQARFRQWCHVLTAEFNPQTFLARMQFFVGPRLKPLVWRVDLGPNPSRVLSEQAKGLRFFYYDQPDASGYVGGIAEMKLGPKLLAKL
jgi:hypothetical protein